MGVVEHLKQARGHHPVTVRVEHAGDALLIRVSGELSLDTIETLETVLQSAAGTEAADILLDLGGVSFIDSVGLRSVVRLANHSLRSGGRVTVQRASPQVQRAIEWAGLERLLPLAS